MLNSPQVSSVAAPGQAASLSVNSAFTAVKRARLRSEISAPASGNSAPTHSAYTPNGPISCSRWTAWLREEAPSTR